MLSDIKIGDVAALIALLINFAVAFIFWCIL